MLIIITPILFLFIIFCLIYILKIPDQGFRIWQSFFMHTVRNEKSIIIEEFLYNKNDDFKREFIFPVYKDK